MDPHCTLVAIGENGDEEALDALGIDFWAAADYADALFRQMGIQTSSTEELVLGAVCQGDVVGAATLGVDQDEMGPIYTFSVVVAPEWRRRGLARALVTQTLELAAEDAETRGAPLQFRVWVVNPHMAALLEDLGFDLESGTEWSLDAPHMTRWG